MDIDTYEQIYSALQGMDDIDKVAEQFSIPAGVLYSILNQKVVTNVKKSLSIVKNNSERHMRMWQKGTTIVQIAKKNKIPATLMAGIILTGLGISKKSFMKNIDVLPDMRIKREVKEAMFSDHFFSPGAHEVHILKGKMGESILEKWLVKNGASFRREDDLRNDGIAKTPDFLLDEVMEIDGKEVIWIESKALFGDEKEHQHYMNKQFSDYAEIFGTGMIVYWYGFLEGIKMDGHLIKDYNFFMDSSDGIEDLLNHRAQW